MQTGYKYALENDYDIAVQFDGDGQPDHVVPGDAVRVNYVEDIIKPIIDGNADFVIGSRFVKELSEFKSTGARRFGIKIISFFIKLFIGTKLRIQLVVLELLIRKLLLNLLKIIQLNIQNLFLQHNY